MIRGNGTAAAGPKVRSDGRAAPIAIIGMRGRFPGANDLDQYWKNVAGAVESITILTPEEMRAAGVPEYISRLPGYVNAAPVLDGIDQFDAQFFGFSARDASLTDPQHRLFLETAWEALEDAGYDPAKYPGAIGVFGGSELSTYLYHLYLNLESLKYIDGMQLMVTNDKDHLCTQVSYRLNLRGPSVTVQTTCSTSLVAVSLACESLQHGRCDMALAGGVTVRVPQRAGYFYTPGSILSPDGHCRPFDANAQGTIVGSGVGLVVLKRLTDALSDGDNIRAVVLGVGLNNDGSDKVGYTAPSFRGQSAAIRAAHHMSGVSAESIGYVEAHGTGTILGDPIELSALTEVFRASTDRRGYCGIGSVKSNFGHLSCAAGVSGLIKTVLALEHGAIPPTVHYKAPNPAIDLATSPFYVTSKLRRWERNGSPRRAGVSSFGVGGTNAHLVIEESPERSAPSQERPYQLLLLAARTPAALDSATARLGSHLDAHPELNLADVAYTLHVGRRFFPHRRVLVISRDERRRASQILGEPKALAAVVADSDASVVFMFPGQGSQYPGMAAGLYQSEPGVRRVIDRCARILKPMLAGDLRRLLFPSPRGRKNAAEALKDTKWAQPALFTVGYALAELWRSWGIQPAAMIGHSVGEYISATLAGVMSLEDALAIIARRGQLISALPRGSMLAVMSAAENMERFVDHKISLAAINAPGLVVLSGPSDAIQGVEAALAKESIAARKLHTSHAFHSSMMDPILPAFEEFVSRIKLGKPTTPYVATLTGDWADWSVMQPGYWSSQLRSTVRFADGVRSLTGANSPAGKNPVYLEVGPGSTLTTFVAQFAKDSARSSAKPGATSNGNAPLCLVSLPSADSQRRDTEEVLTALGQLWAHGIEVDWNGFHRTERRVRASLPTYPFERQSYWIGTRPEAAAEPQARDTANWFYKAVWRETPLATNNQPDQPIPLSGRRVIVFDEQWVLGKMVIEQLRVLGAQPIIVRRGAEFRCISDNEYTLDPGQPDGFRQLTLKVCATGTRLAGVIDCWTASPLDPTSADTDLDAAAIVTLLGPMRLAHFLSDQPTVRPLPLLLVARGTTRVLGDEPIDPARALGVGSARVLPQEHPGLRVAHFDVDADSAVAELLVAEFAAGLPEPTVAMRGGRRFVQAFEPLVVKSATAPQNLPTQPVVFITGGLGHMGLSLAEGLFRDLGARLVLAGRSALPVASQWTARSEDPATAPEQRIVLRRLAAMRAQRDEVLVLKADFNNAQDVKAAVDAAIAHFGRIDLVVHGAARIDAAAFAPVAETGLEVVEAQFSPKLRGLFHLINALRGREPCRWVLHSSISAILGGLGLAVYAGANSMLDALAVKGGQHWISIGWDAWDNAAEAQSASMPLAIKPPEGNEAFLRLLGAPVGSRVLVVVNFADRLKAWVRHEAAPANGTAVDRHPRPNLATHFVEPRTETERRLAEIWGAQLGLESIGIHDRFFDLGGHSLLAAQIASEICDCFQIEMPVLKLFQAPTIAELAELVDRAREGDRADAAPAELPVIETAKLTAPDLQGEAPDVAAKLHYREFYNEVTRRLGQAGVGNASFFLNYGYISLDNGNGDEAHFEVPEHVFNPSSVRLALELIGSMELEGRRVLDVGCGRGGTVALLAERFGAQVSGVDLAPEAVAFCRRTHRGAVGFEIGDAEHLPFEACAFEVLTNIESSHTYPNLRAFFAEVRRVLASGGWFLYTDLLPVARWVEVRVLLGVGFRIASERDITPNVLASCDKVAATRAQAFGGKDAMIDNFLAVPGSAVHEQMQSRAWEYRLLRAQRL
ncbi:MAG: SDR family oxidoreductase [Candidatus Sulfotelmatobacter sp.]